MSLTFTLLKYWEMYCETPSELTIDEIPARPLKIERQFVTSSVLCFKMLFQCFNHYNMYVHMHQVLLLFTLRSNTYHNHVYRRSKNFLIFFWDLSQIKIPEKKSNAISMIYLFTNENSSLDLKNVRLVYLLFAATIFLLGHKNATCNIRFVEFSINKIYNVQGRLILFYICCVMIHV